MDSAAAASALIAGAASFFSPCRFSLLPTYMNGLADGGRASAWRTLLAGAAVSLGILSAVLIVGGALLLAWEAVKTFLRGLLLAGSALIILIGLLVYYNVPERVNASFSPRKAKGLLGLYSYGLFYGSAIAGCGAPAFFLVFAYAAASGSLEAGLALFAVYALGMSALMFMAGLAACWQHGLLRRLARHLPEIQRYAGLLLIVLGAWYALNYVVAIYQSGLGIG